MAPHNWFIPITFSFFLFCLVIPCSNKLQNHSYSATTQIDEVCLRSLDYELCRQEILAGHGHGHSTANLTKLAYHALTLAKANAVGTCRRIKNLRARAAKTSTRWQFELCEQFYEDAMSAIENCVGDLDAGDFGMLSVDAGDAGNNGIACERVLGVNGSSSPLWQQNRFLHGMCYLVVAIADVLPRSS